MTKGMTKNEKDKLYLTSLSEEFQNTLKEEWKGTIDYIEENGWKSPNSPSYISPDIYSLADKYYERLRNVDIHNWTSVEQEIWRMFLGCQAEIVRNKKNLRPSLDFAENLNMLNLNIGIWCIYEWFPKCNLACSYIMNVKSLASDYTKCLLKCIEQVVDGTGVASTPVTYDRIRGRVIIESCNDDPTEVLKKISQVYVNILTNPFSIEFQEFKKWVQTDNHLYGGCKIPRGRILDFLQEIENGDLNLVTIKNYITSQHDGHKAYHIILSYYSPSTGLIYVEIQILDAITRAKDKAICYDGNNCSEVQKIPNREQAHDVYKEFRIAWANEIFASGMNNIRLHGYVSDKLGNYIDDIGIINDRPFGKRFANKHIVPRT